MKPVGFKESNTILYAGDNPETDQLPIARSTHPLVEDGKMPFCISCWKLTPEELERIQETGVVYLAVMGMTQPPVLVMVSNPFTEVGYEAIQP